MHKSVNLLVASALFAACFGLAAVTAQTPMPIPQVPAVAPVPRAQPAPTLQPPSPAPAPQVAVPAPAPAPQAAQKPVTPAPPPAPTPAVRGASEASQPFAPNVRIDVTITDQPATGAAAPIRKSMSVTAMATQRASSSVRSGVNVPVPYSTLPSGSSTPVTSYNYRTMGLNLDVRDIEVRGDEIRVVLMVEYSPLDESEKAAPTPPVPASYSNFSQSLYLSLENGKPIIAAQTSDPVPNRNRTLSVEVKATILK